ncbi:beta-lactamase/transpeptidase-like protein [Pilatotrama ljubarskyi]|nr:beta-lactamase/transpeptidase-like protein [Pilatotrama ljubarskyi]
MRSAGLIASLVLVAAATIAGATQVSLRVTPSASDNPILSPTFHSFVDELRKNTSIPGISIGAVRLGKDKKPQVYLASWGRNTEDGDADDLTPDTLFCLASCSKAFTATSVGLLIDDFAHGRNVTPLPTGVTRLDWDTKVAAILPEQWQLDDPWTTRLASLRDVLGHVSGLPRHDYSYVPGDTTTDVVLRMKHLRTAYELREKWSYNNQMYMLGAHIIAKYANQSYAAFVTERLFNLLNMSSSTYAPSEAQASGKLTHTWTKHGRRIPFWFTEDMTEISAGAGGVISSAEDMVKWLSAWLNEGVDPISGDKVIPHGVYEAVTTAQHVISGHPTPTYGAGILGYGMGWMRWTYRDIEVVSHNGAIPGFSTLVAFSPSSNLGVVVLANADEKAGHTLEIMKRAFDEALDLPSSSISQSQTANEQPGDKPAQPTRESTPSLDLEAYAGTYTSPGYATLTLCSPLSTSHYCAGVLSDFSSLGPLDVDTPQLYGAYLTLFSTHARLRHHSDDTFNIWLTALFPHGYGKNTTAFETYETGEGEGQVVFSIKEGKVVGFSLIADKAAVAARQRRTQGPLEKTADAWFTKV